VRSGLDVAKSIALGAHAAGLALPLIRQVAAGGAEAVVSYLDRLENTLRSVMILTGSRTSAELRTGKIWLDPDFAESVGAFRAAERRINPR
jgi:isopentenyl-diphosphate delta-isomerase